MSAPYREPGSAPSEPPPTDRDHIADVRRSGDTRGMVKMIALSSLGSAALIALVVFLVGGSLFGWLACLGAMTAFVAVQLAIARIVTRRADERMHVASLLDGLDKRDRR